MRKSAAAGVAASGAMVASPRQMRPGHNSAGRPIPDIIAYGLLVKVNPCVICEFTPSLKLERLPVALNPSSLSHDRACRPHELIQGHSTKSERALMPVNEYSAEIVDIGVSRSRSKQIAQAFEESRAIVFDTKHRGIPSKVTRPPTPVIFIHIA